MLSVYVWVTSRIMQEMNTKYENDIRSALVRPSLASACLG